MSFQIDIEDAVCHILSNYSGNDYSDKEKLLFNMINKKIVLKEFSIDELILVGKHNELFHHMEHDYKEFSEDENLNINDWYDKTLKEPSFIFELNNKMFALDGQHRINEIIKRNIKTSNHYLINLNNEEDWIKDLVMETNPYQSC